MAPCRQAAGTYCANVTQTKYADAHRNYLCIDQATRWPELMVFSVYSALASAAYRRNNAVCWHISYECLNKCTQGVRN
jgi:hypothetical protein